MYGMFHGLLPHGTVLRVKESLTQEYAVAGAQYSGEGCTQGTCVFFNEVSPHEL